MENNKLSYISWTVVIAALLIFAGWFLTHGSKANLKTYQNEKVKIEFEYSKDWTNMVTDKALDKLVQLKNPKAYILVNNLRISPMGLKSGQSAYNRLTFESYEELGSEALEIGKTEGFKISFKFVNNGESMQACEVLVPVSDKEMAVVGFYAPAAEFENYKAELEDLVKSISIKN